MIKLSWGSLTLVTSHQKLLQYISLLITKVKTHKNNLKDLHRSYYLLYTDLQTYYPPHNHQNARNSDANMNSPGFVLVLGYKIQDVLKHQRMCVFKECQVQFSQNLSPILTFALIL